MIAVRLRRRCVLLVIACLGLIAAVTAPSALAATSGPAYVEEPGTQPTVDAITDGASVAAPYNTSQGITNFDTLSVNPYNPTDLLPTFSYAGQAASSTSASNGATVEPNVAVYPSTASTASPTEPFISGFAGSPGPLSGYCGSSDSDTWDASMSLNNTAGNLNETSSPVGQPAGEALPFAPYYFPYVVRNADGSLTGYFDWRPKDADEAIVSATSTDNGKTWTTTGEALEQNPGYCPSGDVNDDGEGHPYVTTLGSTTDLYTLQRAIGDYAGTGLDAFPLNTAAADPLSNVQRTTSVGVDPNTFATASTSVPTAVAMPAGVTIPVSTLGGDVANGNSTSESDSANDAFTVPDPSALPNGPAQYEDLTGSVAGTQPPIVTCTGTSGTNAASPALTGCTNPTGITVGANDDLIEVVGTTQAMVTDLTGTATTTIPYGPQNENGAGGNPGGAGTDITLNTTPASGASANTNTITYLLNANNPNRYYINGSTVYCTQSGAEPTTKIEFCTTTNANGVTVSPGTVATGTPIVADPVIPSAGPNFTGGPVTQTNGLLSPDGIIGSLPTSANAAWNEPSTGHVVLYTQKLVNDFIEGAINGTDSGSTSTAYTNDKTASKTAPVTLTTSQTGNSSTLATGFVYTPGTTPTDYNISPFPTEAETLPTTGSFKVYVGAELGTGTNAVTGAEMDTLTCTGWDVNANIPDLYNPNLKTIDLLGCTGGPSVAYGTAGADVLNAGHQGNWVAGPGASIESTNSSGATVLTQIGEGKAVTAKNAQKLFSNNEDDEVVRAAYTTDGINFTDLGAISGSTSNPSATVSGNGPTSGAYTDITDPYQQYAPAGPSGTAFDAANPQGDSPTNGAIGAKDEVELRWPGARGTIVDNADGSIGMFLSGAWASDGDSDAFNQIFYTQSSDGGKTWTTPQIVQSTDYTFSASQTQASNEAAGANTALGVSGYYAGRAYDPTVVSNPDGSVTMVFAGYRLPNPVKPAGTAIGTNAGSQYCELVITNCASISATTAYETEPAIYRNILTETLYPNVGTMAAPTVTTGSASSITGGGATVAGTVQTNEPSTSVSIVYGTSATSLSSSVSAGSVNASTSAQAVSGSLSGLAQGATYYYAVQATNASGTTTGPLQSFTTTGTGTSTTSTVTVTTTTTTPGSTVTTPGATSTVTTPGATSTVTTPGATVTTPGRTVTVTAPATTPTPSTQRTTSTATIGNQKITVTVPSSAVCLAAPAKLSVTYRSAGVAGSKKTKLTLVHATFTLGGKLRETVKKATDAFSLSLTGLKKGTYTLKVTSEYDDRSGTKTRTLTKVQNLTVKVC